MARDLFALAKLFSDSDGASKMEALRVLKRIPKGERAVIPASDESSEETAELKAPKRLLRIPSRTPPILTPAMAHTKAKAVRPSWWRPAAPMERRMERKGFRWFCTHRLKAPIAAAAAPWLPPLKETRESFPHR